jgi:hypothetical protein
MSYDDFTSYFNNMFVCVDFPVEWSGIRYKSSWDADCSGGFPKSLKDEDGCVEWASNPQFCIQNNDE